MLYLARTGLDALTKLVNGCGQIVRKGIDARAQLLQRHNEVETNDPQNKSFRQTENEIRTGNPSENTRDAGQSTHRLKP
ncbi:MAG: hypothetical protein V4661_06910 [Pseudomonadota bacterium]